MSYKKILFALALMASVGAFAQNNGTNSPYSAYGFGLLNDRKGAGAVGMAGTSQGFKGGEILNIQNPASYAQIDSLTLLFDIGMSFQNANLNENGKKVNARNTSVDYVNVGFRPLRNVGMALGMIPFSSIGYSLNRTSTLQTSTGEVTQTDAYSGDGGLHEAYLGLAWKPIKNFSFGANFGYLWGTTKHDVRASFSDATMSSRLRHYESEIRTYKLDFGIQYEQKLDKRNSIVLGATYGLGHDINRNAHFYDQIISTTASKGDTLTAKNAFQLPHSFGVGFVWNHRDRLRVGVDYSCQLWKNVKSPVAAIGADGNYTYTVEKNQFRNMNKVSLGVEYMPNPLSVKWKDHITYRAGVSYSTPYTTINGQEGPKDLTAAVGVGIPIFNPMWSSRPITLNVGLQFEHIQPKVSTQLKENYLRFCLGITFNEGWFSRWKAM